MAYLPILKKQILIVSKQGENFPASSMEAVPAPDVSLFIKSRSLLGYCPIRGSNYLAPTLACVVPAAVIREYTSRNTAKSSLIMTISAV